MKLTVVLATLVLLVATHAARAAETASTPKRDLVSEVRDSERAFAKTMADRDLASFGGYVAEEGVFFGGKGPLRGRAAVVQAWTRFFEGKEAPFSWEPETVEVLPSGNLALTAGPVRDPKGTLIGTFSTIWRLEPDGRWRVAFDRGCEVCAPEPKK
jgi:ketosteroid isomerase-like protein